MQRVAFYTVIGDVDMGVGVMRRANPDFMPASKPQAEPQSILKLKSLAQPAIVHFVVSEYRNADAGLQIRFDGLDRKSVV